MDDAAVKGVLPRLREGDRSAAAELYRAFFPRVFGLCRKLLPSVEDARDAASETFVRAQRAMKTYDETLPFSRWILGIAGNLCVDHLRRRGVEQRIFRQETLEKEEVAAAGPSPLGEALAQEERQTLREALEELPQRYRLPLVLRYYNGSSYDEIARTLQLTRSHVATLLFRAKQELRRSLGTTEMEVQSK